MQPPARLADATLEPAPAKAGDAYEAAAPSQHRALGAVRQFVQAMRRPLPLPRRLLRGLRRRVGLAVPLPHPGLYLAGPVGTGKTHLLAAAYHALAPEVPCAFLHSSRLFRMQEHPEAAARRLAARYRVLCLDEVELDDAANEARLVAFLRTLESSGTALLATSNVEPERFLSTTLGTDRFRRFLTEELRRPSEVVFVGGENSGRRPPAPGRAARGRAWIGPDAATRPAMQAAFERDTGRAHRLSFDALLHAATHTAHEALMRRLTRHDSLYLAGIAVTGTDDALRLLRIVDHLYTDPEAPVLHLSAEAPPEDWFRPAGARRGLERGVAEKFARTVSRLRALCAITHVASPAGEQAVSGNGYSS